MKPINYLVAFISIGLAVTGSNLASAQEQASKRQEIKTQTQEQAREHREIKTQTQEQIKTQEQARERIYGHDLMTEQERNEYRERLRAMNTEEERNAFRAQHHEEMKKRARERNMEIPDDVPAQGMGKGKGKEMSHGHGKAYGHGQGSGSGPGSKGQRKGGK